MRSVVAPSSCFGDSALDLSTQVGPLPLTVTRAQAGVSATPQQFLSEQYLTKKNTPIKGRVNFKDWFLMQKREYMTKRWVVNNKRVSTTGGGGTFLLTGKILVPSRGSVEHHYEQKL